MHPPKTRARIALVCAGLSLAAALGTPSFGQEEKTFRTPVKDAAPGRLSVETPLGKGLLALYVSAPWDQPLPEVTRAVVLVHGLHRDAANSFRVLHKAEKAAGTTTVTTLLLAPQFLSQEDAAGHQVSPETLRWKAGSWMGGIAAESPARLNSFDGMDAILTRLADHTRYPKLTQVVVAGHSAGGQFVQRYAVAGRGEATLIKAGIHVRYVVANPSSYVYFDQDRPTPTGSFSPFNVASCPGFNEWKYGLQPSKKLPQYVAQSPLGELEAQYMKRDVVYLLGTADSNPNHPELDKNCAAEAEGPHRYARGHAYASYLQQRHPTDGHHRVWDVPGVAHDTGRMMTSACGLAALFDKPGCAAP